MTDFIREVQEDLQRDRALKLWRRFRYPLLGVVVAIIAAVAVVVVLEDADRARSQAEAERFAAAQALLEAGKGAEAAEAFATLAGESEGGFAALALLRAADAKAKAGDDAGAVAMLDALAKNSRVEPHYRDLANLLAAERLVDSATPEEIDSRLATLLSPGNPWRALASELKAAAELCAGRTDAARATLSTLVDDPNATSGVRFRARELLDGLGGPLPKPEPAAATGTTEGEVAPKIDGAPATESAPATEGEAAGQ